MSDYTEYYKQAWERSLMKNHTTHHDGCDCVMDKIQKLESENARLRKALEWYGNIVSWGKDNDFGIIAREALKGN